MRIQTLFLSAVLLVAASACGDGKGGDAGSESARQAPAPAAQAPTGRTIEIKMITDDKGNYYDPANIEAKQGDVLRFTIVSGVHNVHFTPERNPGVTGLPPASDLLQLPGQTYDFVVNLPPGSYGFQCDPHALLGMVGTLKVS